MGMAEKERQGDKAPGQRRLLRGQKKEPQGWERKSHLAHPALHSPSMISLQGSSPSTLVCRGDTYMYCQKARRGVSEPMVFTGHHGFLPSEKQASLQPSQAYDVCTGQP